MDDNSFIGAFMYAEPNVPKWNISGDLSDFWALVDEISTDDPLPSTQAPPVAYFEASIPGCDAPYRLTLQDLSAGASEVSWRFGDGSPSLTGTTVSHTFSTPGPFTVELRVTNAFGADTASRFVNFRCPTDYASFFAGKLSLIPWEGERVALLTEKGSYNPTSVAGLLTNLDSAYSFYADLTGAHPSPASRFNQKLTIARVPTSCGAGCGYLGATGIEILGYFFDFVYGVYDKTGRDHHILYYELGRNFWFYSSQLHFGPYSSAATGFAIHSQFGALRRAGQTDPQKINGYA